MVIFLRWGWLLGIALLGPIALPAGGAQLVIPQVRFRKPSDPWLSTKAARLRATPLQNAPIVRTVRVGTPLKIVRRWHGSDGKEWVYVQISLTDDLRVNSVRNGWIDA